MFFLVKRAGTVQPSLFLLKFPCEQVEFRQTPAGVDREDRSQLLFPRSDPGSIPAPAKRKAGGNKNLRQRDPWSHPADECRRTQRVDESLVRLKFLLFMQRKAGCANLAQKSPWFGQMCKRCAESVQPLSYIKKERQILRFDVQYLVHLQGLEPWAHWLRVSCSTNWARGAYYQDAVSNILITMSRRLPIFTRRFQRTILGTSELNYCVRNGNRWDLTVIVTDHMTGLV